MVVMVSLFGSLCEGRLIQRLLEVEVGWVSRFWLSYLPKGFWC